MEGLWNDDPSFSIYANYARFALVSRSVLYAQIAEIQSSLTVDAHDGSTLTYKEHITCARLQMMTT